MYHKILVAYDGSAGAELALDRGIELAGTLGARLTILWVKDSLPHFPETVDEIEEEEEVADKFFEKLASRVRSRAKAQGVEAHVEARAGNPAQRISGYAKRRSFDLVIVGASGHSRLWGHLLGHTADRLSDCAPCSVWIVRDPDGHAPDHCLLVGFDGSPSAEVALRHATSLAEPLGATLRILCVFEAAQQPVSAADEGEGRAEKFFQAVCRDRVQKRAEELGRPLEEHCRRGDPAQELIAEARELRARALIVGRSGTSGLWNALRGSKANRISHYAPCDVLVVHETASGREERP